jgi:hypothetical protein
MNSEEFIYNGFKVVVYSDFGEVFKIQGYCKYGKKPYMSVITFEYIYSKKKWDIYKNARLPYNIDDAILTVKCMNQTIAKLNIFRNKL